MKTLRQPAKGDKGTSPTKRKASPAVSATIVSEATADRDTINRVLRQWGLPSVDSDAFRTLASEGDKVGPFQPLGVYLFDDPDGELARAALALAYRRWNERAAVTGGDEATKVARLLGALREAVCWDLGDSLVAVDKALKAHDAAKLKRMGDLSQSFLKDGAEKLRAPANWWLLGTVFTVDGVSVKWRTHEGQEPLLHPFVLRPQAAQDAAINAATGALYAGVMDPYSDAAGQSPEVREAFALKLLEEIRWRLREKWRWLAQKFGKGVDADRRGHVALLLARFAAEAVKALNPDAGARVSTDLDRLAWRAAQESEG